MSSEPAPPPAPPRENPFANFPDWLLADTIGDISAEKATNEARLKLAKAEMDRRHKRSIEGTRFAVSKGEETERRLDSAGLKKKYGLTWYEEWYKTITRTKWTVTPLAPPEVGGGA